MRAGGQRKEKERQRRRGLGQRDVSGLGAERHHQPGRANALHERADVGDDICDEQLTKIGVRRGRHKLVVFFGAIAEASRLCEGAESGAPPWVRERE